MTNSNMRQKNYVWVERACELLREGATRGEAAKGAGITRAALMNALRRNAEVADQILDAEEHAVERIGKVIMRIAEDDDHPDQFKAATFIADRRLKQWARDAQSVQIAIEHRHTVSLTTGEEEIRERLDRVTARLEQRALASVSDDITDAEIID